MLIPTPVKQRDKDTLFKKKKKKVTISDFTKRRLAVLPFNHGAKLIMYDFGFNQIAFYGQAT